MLNNFEHEVDNKATEERGKFVSINAALTNARRSNKSISQVQGGIKQNGFEEAGWSHYYTLSKY